MNKLFQMVGGRKFLLTVVAMIGGALIDLGTAKGLSMPLATFLGAALAAFCASNYAVSKEYMRTEAQKKTSTGGGDSDKKLETILDKLGSIELELSMQASTTNNAQLTEIQELLVQLASTTGNTFKAAQATQATLQRAVDLAKKG